MNVNDKIKQILIDKSLSPSVFADEIGVQRSSISHILSGRNRPSFDIIQKVIRRFPDLGYDWIMEEEGPDEKQYSAKRTGAGLRNETNPIGTARDSSTSQQRMAPVGSPVPVSALTTPEPPILESPVAGTTPGKTVERILIFYKDGTFREYTPAG